MKSLNVRKWLTALFIMCCVVIIACKKVEDKPKPVAQAFVEAVLKEDFNEAGKYASAESQSALEMLKSAKEAYKRFGKEEEFDIARELKGKKIDYTEPLLDGPDRAKVSVLADGKETFPLILVRQDNSWKVAFDKATIMDHER